MNDDFVMTIDDDEEVVIDEVMEDISEEEKEEKAKPVDKKTAKKLRKQANREQKQGIKPAAVEEKKKSKKANTEDFDDEFTFSMDGGGRGAQNAWDFTTARGMLKGKQVRRDTYCSRKKGIECFILLIGRCR